MQNKLGARPDITEACGEAPLDVIIRSGRMNQDENQKRLNTEIDVSWPMVFRFSPAQKRTSHTMQPFSPSCNQFDRKS
jgi:hypothetical protein